MQTTDKTAKQPNDFSPASSPAGSPSSASQVLAKLGIDRSLLTTLVVIILLRTMVVGHFVIPSGSMLPTLKIGDHVFVNELAYGLHLPLMKRNLFNWSYPQRGEIVVFPHPVDGTTLIKRVIGLPGDEIRYDSGRLVINDKLVNEERVQTPGKLLEDLGDNVDASTLYMETLPGGTRHAMLRGAYEGFTYREQNRWKVPEGHVFVSGDNRDNSVDSRFWGFVPSISIYGPAVFITYSTIDRPGPLPGLRADRFFAPIDPKP